MCEQASRVILYVALLVVIAVPCNAAFGAELSYTDGLELWLKADEGIRDASGRAPGEVGFDGSVAQWLDSSGNSHHAAQAVADKRPGYVDVAAGWIYNPCVEFDGSNDNLWTSDSINYSTSFTVFKTDYASVFPDYKGLIDINQFSSYALMQGQSGSSDIGYMGADNHPSDPNLVQNYLNGVPSFDSSNEKRLNPMPLDGHYYATQVLTAGAGQVLPQGQFVLADIHNRSGRSLDGQIAEVLVFDHPLNTQQIDEVHAYIEEKYFTAPPMPTDGLQLWLKSGDVLDGSGKTPATAGFDGSVATWVDSSGNGRDAVQTDADKRPDYVATVAELRNQSTMQFDGTDDGLSISERILGQDVQEFTMFAVSKYNSGNNSSAIGIRSNLSLPLIQLDTDSAGNGRFIVKTSGGSANASATVGHAGEYGIAAGILSRDSGSGLSTASYLFNGLTEASATADLGSGALTSGIQSIGSLGPDSFFWDGDIAEVLIYDRALDARELAAVHAYLDEKFLQPLPPPEPPTEGMQVWLKADEGVTTYGGYVDQWLDQSGGGNDAEAPDLAAQPMYVSSNADINDRPVLQFDGHYTSMVIDKQIFDSDTKEMTLVAVARSTKDGYSLIGGRGFTSTPSFQLDIDDQGVAQFAFEDTAGNTLASAGASGLPEEFGIWMGRLSYNEASGEFTIQSFANGYGSDPVTGTLDGVIIPYETRIGSLYGLFPDEWFEGDIAEIMMYDRALGEEDMIDLGDYLSIKYGLDFTLENFPVSHVPGDANRDGVVDDADAAILASNWLESGADWSQGDFNGDGNVDNLDATILAANWQVGVGETSSIPEPGVASYLLCIFAGLFFKSARRKA